MGRIFFYRKCVCINRIYHTKSESDLFCLSEIFKTRFLLQNNHLNLWMSVVKFTNFFVVKQPVLNAIVLKLSGKESFNRIIVFGNHQRINNFFNQSE